MCKTTDEPAPIETMAITPIYYDSISPVEIIDGMLHITLTAMQPRVGGGTEQVVVARLMVRPDKVETHRAAIDKAFRMAAEATRETRALSH